MVGGSRRIGKKENAGPIDKKIDAAKIVAGIIAIPASLLGIAISIQLFRKTNLESRKLDLEIREKERELQEYVSNKKQEIFTPFPKITAANARIMLLIVGYVILQLTLRFWNLILSVFSRIVYAATTTAYIAIDPTKTPDILSPRTTSGALMFSSRSRR